MNSSFSLQGVFHPYQIELKDDGMLIYSWADNDSCIQKAARFEVGDHVWCKCGGQWKSGRVVSHNCQQPDGVFRPYQIELKDGLLIYAWADDDACIQKADRFEIGTRVQCFVATGVDTGQWCKGSVVAHKYEDSPGVFYPYQVKLHDGRLIYSPTDDDKCIQQLVAHAPRVGSRLCPYPKPPRRLAPALGRVRDEE